MYLPAALFVVAVYSSGWNGTRCLMLYGKRTGGARMDNCEHARPCKNGATCINLQANNSCLCPPGLSGRNCTRCQDGLKNFTCICKPGFSGQDCGVFVPACASEPCLHGGVCNESSAGSFNCTCPTGSEGRRCETLTAVSLHGGRPLLLRMDGGRKRKRRSADVGLSWSMTLPVMVDAAVLVLSADNFVAVLMLFHRRFHLNVFNSGNFSSVSGELVANDTEPASGLSEGRYRFLADSSGVHVSHPCLRGNCSLHWSSPTSTLLLSNVTFALGGVDRSMPLLRTLVNAGAASRIRACVSNVTFGGLRVNLTRLVPLGAAVCSSDPPSCHSNTCKNGGRCVATWTGVECRCSAGYSGENCELWTSATMRSGDLLYLSFSSPVRNLSLNFTVDKNASSSGRLVLIYTLRESNLSTPLMLSLVDGFAEISVYSGSLVSTLRSNTSSYDDGLQHNIQIFFTNDTVTSSIAPHERLTILGLRVDRDLHLGTFDYSIEKNPWPNIFSSKTNASLCVGPLAVSGRILDFDTGSGPYGMNKPERGCRALLNTHAHEFTFLGGLSYARLEIDSTRVSMSRRLQAWFRTRDSNASLLHILFGDPAASIEWRLRDGKVVVETRVGNVRANRVRPFSSPASDGHWHEVSVRFLHFSRSIRLSLDNENISTTFNVSLFGMQSRIIYISVGARPSIPDRPSIKGCFRRLLIDDSHYLSLTPSTSNFKMASSDVCTGCCCDPKHPPSRYEFSCPYLSTPTSDPCMSGLPCRNGGTCIRENASDVRCRCSVEFYGSFCERRREVKVVSTEEERSKRRKSSVAGSKASPFLMLLLLILSACAIGAIFAWKMNRLRNKK